MPPTFAKGTPGAKGTLTKKKGVRLDKGDCQARKAGGARWKKMSMATKAALPKGRREKQIKRGGLDRGAWKKGVSRGGI